MLVLIIMRADYLQLCVIQCCMGSAYVPLFIRGMYMALLMASAATKVPHFHLGNIQAAVACATGQGGSYNILHVCTLFMCAIAALKC